MIFFIVFSFGLSKRKGDAAFHQQKSDSTFDQFLAEDVFIDFWKGEQLSCVISAEQIVHRDRMSKLFRYHNLKEIYFSNFKFEYYENEKEFKSGKSLNCIIGTVLVQDIIDIFFSNNCNFQMAQSFQRNKPSRKKLRQLFTKNEKKDSSLNGPEVIFNHHTENSNYKVLTNIRIDNLLIEIHRNIGSCLRILSDHASVSLLSRNITLSGNVSITDTKNKTITAPEATWVYETNDIIFPQGYVLYPFKEQKQAIFSMNSSGELTKSTNGQKNVNTKDILVEMEKMLENQLIAPVLNAFYLSILTEGKVDFSTLKRVLEEKKQPDSDLVTQ